MLGVRLSFLIRESLLINTTGINCFTCRCLSVSTVLMANSRFEYVRKFEESTNPILVKSCFIAVRIDGNKFHQFSKDHQFYKPNDKRALDLMAETGKNVMKDFYPAIKMAYGQSDEFSFIISRSSDLFNRRANKLISIIVSKFTAFYQFHWSKYMKDVILQYPPSFDARCVLYPGTQEIVDYLKWRQADCHINNLYNTTFYCLTGEYRSVKVKENGEISFNQLDNEKSSSAIPLSHQEAQTKLKGTVSGDKNDIMFLQYGVNYNNEMEQFKKGTFLYLDNEKKETDKQDKSKNFPMLKSLKDRDDIKINCCNTDIIKDTFWNDHKYLLD